MARGLHRLTDREIKNNTQPGRLSDGGNLLLRTKESGAKSWSFKWKTRGKAYEVGLGPYPTISLKDAREIAAEHRKTIAAGGDPRAKKSQATGKTFAECADEHINLKRVGWTDPTNESQWRHSLRDHAIPINEMPVADIDLEHVLECLTPIWKEIPETAARVQARIKSVLDFSITKRYRENRYNPAVWQGNLESILPKLRGKDRQSFAALPAEQVPDFMNALRSRRALSARLFEFKILTCLRSKEAAGARWEEIDFKAAVWTVPAERMKGRKTHRVPLTSEMAAILEPLRATADSEYVFASTGEEGHITENSLIMLLGRMNRNDITAHGFRSTFRDWAGDNTNAPREIAEAALAHAVGSATERAYRRGDALEKRRQLMEQWCRYCYGREESKVVPLRAR